MTQAYQALERATHSTVKNSVKEYINGMAHISGTEFSRLLWKRGYFDTYHKTSPEHQQRYVDEFAKQRYVRHLDTMEQTAEELVGKLLTYKILTQNIGSDTTTT
ncbi:MAG: transposase [Bacteroidetes bacterium]|nr:transposase [Bacteroidota bacterium]